MMAGFKNQIEEFSCLLDKVDVNLVSTNQYCRNYLSHILTHRIYYLSIYSDVLKKAVETSGKHQSILTLLDYGAGNGLLGIFAKYCGFGKILINEIDNEFLLSSKLLSECFDIKIDKFIPGDIESVKIETINEKPDVIVATDVIEHIYDLDDFFSSLKQINPNIISLFTTGSNPRNPFKVFRLKKLQRKDEYFGANPDDFALCGAEAHAAYIEIRKKIIKEYIPQLLDSEVITLAKRTRGMRKDHIIDAISAYRQTAILPDKPDHVTNTCHPLTGSWTERILTLDEYRKIYRAAGFQLKTNCGFYNIYKKGLKGFVSRILNRLISTFGMYISPFIILTGENLKINEN